MHTSTLTLLVLVALASTVLSGNTKPEKYHKDDHPCGLMSNGWEQVPCQDNRSCQSLQGYHPSIKMCLPNYEGSQCGKVQETVVHCGPDMTCMYDKDKDGKELTSGMCYPNEEQAKMIDEAKKKRKEAKGKTFSPPVVLGSECNNEDETKQCRWSALCLKGRCEPRIGFGRECDIVSRDRYDDDYITEKRLCRTQLECVEGPDGRAICQAKVPRYIMDHYHRKNLLAPPKKRVVPGPLDFIELNMPKKVAPKSD